MFRHAFETSIVLAAAFITLLLGGVDVFRYPWLWAVAWLLYFAYLRSRLPASSKRTRRAHHG